MSMLFNTEVLRLESQLRRHGPTHKGGDSEVHTYIRDSSEGDMERIPPGVQVKSQGGWGRQHMNTGKRPFLLCEDLNRLK